MELLLPLRAPRQPRPRDGHRPRRRHRRTDGAGPTRPPPPRPPPPPAPALAPPLTSPSICTCLTAESPVAAALPLPFEAPKPPPAAPELSLRDAIFPLTPAGKRKTKHRKQRQRRRCAGKRLRAETRGGGERGACAVPPLSPRRHGGDSSGPRRSLGARTVSGRSGPALLWLCQLVRRPQVVLEQEKPCALRQAAAATPPQPGREGG